ncbi:MULTISPECIES: hypothetical protein [unclassified Methylobacterium]|uniref:hypothetical protein n=1 Tax=unclassified Methylobacterium TaxID=2615210 RepID=UPI0006FED6B6|nr:MULTISPECIES: hypothetical protein [unclassified Methylobacterium]KQP92186.1 hypothetical protein ASF57_06970 [Methylobacterium sp. Leaf117]MCK2054513.1 hypothetical protein [Methylobacterium sp. 37f]
MKPVTLAALLMLAGAPALAQTAPATPASPEVPAVTKTNTTTAPNASDLLFEQPQMKNVPPGTSLTYTYLRRSGISKGPFGPPLDDTIKLGIEPGNAAENRNIRVQMFSGANRFPAGPFEDMPGNPVMTLFLEHHLMDLARVLMANPRYIKNAIRKGLRDNATVTPTQVDYKGRKVDAWRITTQPFVGDKMKERMRGFENLTYTFVTSDAVPGELVSIEASSKNAEGGELLQENLTYDQNAG